MERKKLDIGGINYYRTCRKLHLPQKRSYEVYWYPLALPFQTPMFLTITLFTSLCPYPLSSSLQILTFFYSSSLHRFYGPDLCHHSISAKAISPFPFSFSFSQSPSVSLPPSLPSSHLHVSLQLNQMKAVPGDKTRALVGEVYASKAGLARPEVRFTDRVVVAPNKVVVNGDVLKLRGVAIRPKHLLVPSDERSSR